MNERLLLALLIAVVGAALGAGVAAWHFEPQLAAANRSLGEFKNAYASLAAASAHQNDAIEAERRAGEARAAQARTAAAAAEQQAEPHYRAAGVILGLKPSAGADPCTAARAAFDAELREERGKP